MFDHLSPDASAWAIAGSIFGYVGAMLSGSKQTQPGREIVWNANICTKEHGKVWFGDFELTNGGEDKLIELANRLGVRVYLLREHDARFDNEKKPLFENAVYTTEGGQ